MGWLRKICVYLGETTSIGERQKWGEVSRVRFHGESLASRPSKPLLARKDRYVHGRHGLPGHTSVLVSDGENLASMFVLVRSLAGRGRRPSTEYDAHLEISSRTTVSRVLLGSTVDQVSALSPALNLTPSMNMVLTVARRRRRSSGWSLPVRPVRDIWWSWLRWLGSHRARVGFRLGGICAVHV